MSEANKQVNMNVETNQIRESWRTFLIEVTFAENYKTPYIIESGGPVLSNPILDNLLPSLLLVKLTSLVDEALGEYITQKGLLMPKTYRGDFNGRINFLRDSGYLKDATKLHELRELRNELAHESTGKVGWAELEKAIETADDELQQLGLVGTRPKFEVSAERVTVEPTDPKYLMTFNYSVTLKSGGCKVAELTWSKHLHRDES
jgi:hypothetical protein